eukprot:2223938-Rhodomonas_salina.2
MGLATALAVDKPGTWLVFFLVCVGVVRVCVCARVFVCEGETPRAVKGRAVEYCCWQQRRNWCRQAPADHTTSRQFSITNKTSQPRSDFVHFALSQQVDAITAFSACLGGSQR